MHRIRLTGRLVRTPISRAVHLRRGCMGHTGSHDRRRQLLVLRISTKQVVQGKETNALDRMGPYPDKATAEQALKIAAARNKAADSDDDWNN